MGREIDVILKQVQRLIINVFQLEWWFNIWSGGGRSKVLECGETNMNQATINTAVSNCRFNFQITFSFERILHQQFVGKLPRIVIENSIFFSICACSGSPTITWIDGGEHFYRFHGAWFILEASRVLQGFIEERGFLKTKVEPPYISVWKLVFSGEACLEFTKPSP